MDDKQHGRRALEGAVVDEPRAVRIGRHAAVNPDIARHRAETLDDPANTGPIMVPIGRAKLVARVSAVLAAAGLVGTAGYAASAPRPAALGPEQPLEPVVTSQQPIVAPKRALREPKVTVKAVPKPQPVRRQVPKVPARVFPAPPVLAPVLPAPVPAPVIPAPQPAPPVRVVPAPQPVPVVPAKPAPVVPTLPKPVPVVPKPVPPPSSKAAQIAYAARAQLGRFQDCTMLVTNALATVGINFHGWPAGYFSLGRTVAPAEAVPGDLVYYQNGGMGVAHIAVYVGGGMAVHGGWNGNNTVLFSSQVGSGPVFIRVY